LWYNLPATSACPGSRRYHAQRVIESRRCSPRTDKDGDVWAGGWCRLLFNARRHFRFRLSFTFRTASVISVDCILRYRSSGLDQPNRPIPKPPRLFVRFDPLLPLSSKSMASPFSSSSSTSSRPPSAPAPRFGRELLSFVSASASILSSLSCTFLFCSPF